MCGLGETTLQEEEEGHFIYKPDHRSSPLTALKCKSVDSSSTMMDVSLLSRELWGWVIRFAFDAIGRGF